MQVDCAVRIVDPVFIVFQKLKNGTMPDRIKRKGDRCQVVVFFRRRCSVEAYDRNILRHRKSELVQCLDAPARHLIVMAPEYRREISCRFFLFERNENRIRGASTISQQTAKNLFLWDGRSWVRKGLEAGLTLGIETVWSKKRILTVYLNIAEFGDGVFGVEAAAQRYFHKPASKLTRSEAALLAAVLPNPLRFKVSAPSGYVRSRQAWILRQMYQLGGEPFMQQHQLD